jgi:starvation-inducible outer membrane lipoprotein
LLRGELIDLWGMEKRSRLARLRDLAAEVHRLPRSSGRDSLLRELRGRAVAVDTGAADPSGWTDHEVSVEGQQETDRAGLERGLSL